MLLNIDAGELPSEPEELYRLAHLVHIACGGHAGDEASMTRALERALRHGTRCGAHPSYPDRAGFGRVVVAIGNDELRRSVEVQCRALAERARLAGAVLTSVKPHGALYHEAARDPAVADAVVTAATAALGGSVAVVGPPRGALRDAAEVRRLVYLAEGFADRGLRADGSLIPRGEAGAVLTSPREAAAQARALAAAGAVHTLCVHGDNPAALLIASAVRAALDELEGSVPSP